MLQGTVVHRPSPRSDVASGIIDINSCPLRVTSYGGASVIEGRVNSSAEHCCEHHAILQSLRETDRLSLRKLFHTLPPPAMQSLSGEFDGELLNQGGSLSKMLTKRVFGMHGSWLGKAFHGLTEDSGVGYNYFRFRKTIIQKLPMDLQIVTSTMDDQPSLRICYKSKNRGLIRGLFGEVRQLTPHIMLGIGVFGPVIGKRDIFRRKIPFVLVGPYRPYQHVRSGH